MWIGFCETTTQTRIEAVSSRRFTYDYDVASDGNEVRDENATENLKANQIALNKVHISTAW